MNRLSPRSLATASSRRPWTTVSAWLVLVVASLAAIVLFLGSALTTESGVTSKPESVRANALLAEAFPRESEEAELVVVRSDAHTVDDAAFRAKVDELFAAGARTGVVAQAVSFYETGDETLVSRDRDALLVPLVLRSDDVSPLVELVREGSAGDFQVTVTGERTIDADFETLSQEDLQKGELFFGLPAALVILVLVFGTLVAGLVPLALALVSIVVAVALTALLGQAYELSFFVVNMISGMGLALGIDYSLFILSRFREERGAGREKLDAIAAAGDTASRAVLFSGIAFVLAMVGMVLVPDTILRSLAVGAILVGIVSVLAAQTLLPAVLSLLGDRVNALRIPVIGRSVARDAAAEGRFWGGVVRRVMRRPVVSLVAAAALLLAAAAPVLDLHTGFAGISTLPDRFPSKEGFDTLAAEFPGAGVDPLRVVVAGDTDSAAVQAGVERLRTAVEENPVLREPGPLVPSESGDVGVLEIPVDGDPASSRAVEAVRDLRAETIPEAFAGTDARVLVTGATAENADYFDLVATWLPIVFAFVLGLSFVLLTIAFRSIVVPAVAIVMNLLSVGAAYGLLVLVFQKGIGADFLGLRHVDAIEAWVPLFLFSVLFGLSMDYQVFLLSRIRERFAQTGDPSDAVSFGVTTTARLITGAALIIVAVFTGFATGDLVMFQQMGFGVAVALLVDATIVRSVLVPAAMRLLGERNWYLPSWLDWLPDVQVEGHEPEREPARAAAA